MFWVSNLGWKTVAWKTERGVLQEPIDLSKINQRHWVTSVESCHTCLSTRHSIKSQQMFALVKIYFTNIQKQNLFTYTKYNHCPF